MHDVAPATTARVLLVEDNRVNQLVARAMLEQLGFSVDVVADGLAAVKTAARVSYRAILMDCQIPVLDGYGATIEIRRVQGAARRTPIIAITASTTNANHRRCLAAGMDDYLTKPLGLSELRAALTRWAPEHAPRTTDDPAPRAPVPTVAVPEVVVAPETESGAVDVAVLAAHSERAVLDLEVVTRLEQLGATAGENLMGQLAELFLASADVRIDELRDALARPDPAAVAAAAHSLRGASANLGATDLARRCTMLETHGNAGNLGRGDVILEALELELARVRGALEAWLPSPAEAS
jgi:CheY-like chemotaxis protein/HPt (histidine-containing phosphotransfer) domain-containing protein